MKRMIAVLCLCAVWTGIAVAQEYSFAITDLEGLESLQREFGPFKEQLERLTGYTLKFYPVGNRTAAVEAMKSGRVDFVLTGPAEYVVFKTRVNSKIVCGFSRPDYFGVIVSLADSGITSVSGLKGKKIALGDVGSTSKHLAPVQIISDNGLNPQTDVEKVHTSIKLGWEALKRGDVAAFATTNDKFLSLREAETDFEPGAFKVIARGPDLPNDVLLAGTHVPTAAIEKMKTAITSNSAALVREILKGEDNKKYLGMKFLTGIQDRDYNYIREMYKNAGYPQFSRFIGE
ncbi:MAG: PhnD/SsuA/transferrin family substrate-binding protein [Spirochaetales bacterium]|nr:PhnD/SsuA/transferrin family substrate-binding protein [Spirochaetales bacterium]